MLLKNLDTYNNNKLLAEELGIFESCEVLMSVNRRERLWPGIIRVTSDKSRFFIKQPEIEGLDLRGRGLSFIKYSLSFISDLDAITDQGLILQPVYQRLFDLLLKNNINTASIISTEGVITTIHDNDHDIFANSVSKKGFNQSFATAFLNYIDLLEPKNVELAKELLFYGYK